MCNKIKKIHATLFQLKVYQFDLSEQVEVLRYISFQPQNYFKELKSLTKN